MNFSYWENKHFVTQSDVTIVGAGITGLTTAVFLKTKYPAKTISVLERGLTPWGASTKNAGFACFGSISELLSDIEKIGESKTISLVEKRWKGLNELRSLLSDDGIGLINNGGYELFTKNQSQLAGKCEKKLDYINQLIHPIFKEKVFHLTQNTFEFNRVDQIIKCKHESQVDTGLMMKSLVKKAKEIGVEIFFGANIEKYEKETYHIRLLIEGGMSFKTRKLIICSNGFAKSILPTLNVKPARAQVLITKEIPNLKIKGTFHMEEGFYYFRNIDNRILFGGGRNLDLVAEETTEMETTDKIIGKLKEYLDSVILPNVQYEVDYSWAGIMGVGQDKDPIIQEVEDSVYCGVKFGGMGVALGTLVGKELSEMIEF
jgi:glycine/D-amino acid oxidase-like deaminating enzyme